MKYKCDKCGLEFDDYVEARAHEEKCGSNSLEKDIADLKRRVEFIETELYAMKMHSNPSADLLSYPPIKLNHL